jgi:class 3 adenylate cyclase
MRRVLRNTFAVTVALVLLAQAAMTIATLHQDFAVFGYTISLDGVTVGVVTHGFPAERAGLRGGDRLVYSRLSLMARLNSALSRAVPSGTVLPFVFERNGTVRTISMRARDFAPGFDPVLRVSTILAGMILVSIGLALMLLRPTRMTWGFLLWTLYTLGGFTWMTLRAETSVAPFVAWSVVQAGIAGLSSTGLLMFVSRFPASEPQGRLRLLAAAAPAYGVAIFFLSLLQTVFVAAGIAPPPAWLLGTMIWGVPLCNVMVSIAGLTTTLLSRKGGIARRIAPVLISIVLASTFSAAVSVQNLIRIDPAMENGLMSAMTLSVLAVAISVAYGVVKHRVIEIGFMVGRTLVFTACSAAVIGALIVLHRMLVQGVSSQALRAFAEVAGATAIGVAVPRIHGIVGNIVDRTIFLHRYLAEKQLLQVADAIECADDSATIAELLVQRPMQALSLTSAAFFRREPDGRFARLAAIGWPRGSTTMLASNDLLVLYLTSSPEAMRIDETDLAAEIPHGNRVPVLAIPVLVRKQLHGIVLYGHSSGESEIEADQQRVLERLVKAASFALEAIALDERARDANRERDLAQTKLVHTLEAHIDELERLNAARARFIPDEFLRLLGKDGIDRIALGDNVEREMSVLFADIRDFTGISQQLAPSESFDYLNAYLNRVGPLIREHGGFIDKYIGDSVMALFAGDGDAALDAALALQREVRVYASMLQAQGKPRLAVGIGLHFGRLMLGTIGERARMETTVISDAVNLASRIEGVTKLYDASIVVSRAVVDGLRGRERYQLRSLGRVVVKGSREPVELFEAYGADAPEIVALKARSARDFASALRSFERGEWVEAQRAFESIAAENAGDGPARHFLHRCNALLESGSLAWDGVQRLQTK